MIAGSRADHAPHEQRYAAAGDLSDARITTSSPRIAFFLLHLVVSLSNKGGHVSLVPELRLPLFS